MKFTKAKAVDYNEKPTAQEETKEVSKTEETKTDVEQAENTDTNDNKDKVKDEKQDEKQDEQKPQNGQESQREESDDEIRKDEQSQNEVKSTLSDDDVVKFLKENKGLDIDSLDALNKQGEDVPEDIKKFLEYKKETNRSYQDYLELQKDWSKADNEEVLSKYLKDKNPLFDDEDIKDELSELSIDEDLDDDSDIRKKKRKKKKLLSEALDYLNSQKEKYKQPKEGSSEVDIPDEYKEYKQKLSDIMNSRKENDELVKKRYEGFLNETKQIFNEEFKGFEFDINGEKKVFKSNEGQEVLQNQSDIHNFVSKFTDKDGAIKDVKGYHKALNAAMNADSFAKHFYELGQQEAITNEAKDSKNINFEGRKPQEGRAKKQKYRAVENSNSSSYKIKY